MLKDTAMGFWQLFATVNQMDLSFIQEYEMLLSIICVKESEYELK
jgi:hypothetical protein